MDTAGHGESMSHLPLISRIDYAERRDESHDKFNTAMVYRAGGVDGVVARER